MTEGTRIKIEGQKVKAENGSFEITAIIPQPDRENYYLYKRVTKAGKVSQSTKNLRGAWGKRLEKIAEVI